MQSITRRFAIFTLPAFLFAAGLLIFFFRSAVFADLVGIAERGHVDLTRSLSRELHTQYFELLNRSSSLKADDPQLVNLRDSVIAATKDTALVKIKIYNLMGVTVFSTDPSQLGENKYNNDGFISARAGTPISDLTFRNEFNSFDRVIEDRNVLSSYVPVASPHTGQTVGVFELYSDVSPLVSRIEEQQRDLMIIIGLIFISVVGAQLWLTYRLEMRLKTERIRRTTALERLDHDARHDPLTGLINRTALFHALESELAHKSGNANKPFALLGIDLDRFKVVNDSLGHTAGDALLDLAARRLEWCTRGDDLVARLGGDEFAILLRSADNAEDVHLAAQRILSRFREPFEVNGRSVVTTVSMGVLIGGDMIKSAEEALRNVDIAMYQAKAKGKNGLQIFNAAMHREAINRLELEADLRVSMDRDDFLNHYQPIYDLKTRRIAAVESLLRWQHPVDGQLLPSHFLATAEEAQLLTRLDLAAIERSLDDLKVWRNAAPELTKTLRLSVNLSPTALGDPEWIDSLEELVDQSGVDPRDIQFELTEAAIIRDEDLVAEVIERLRAKGSTIALDDFGTGYSSLSHLRRFRFDMLKIDRAFVAGMTHSDEDRQIVQATINMGENLNIPVTAEGVETAKQLDSLRAMNCQFAQGNLLSQPVEGDEVIGQIKRLTVGSAQMMN